MLEGSLLLKVKNIPNTFGVYMFLDKEKKPIYIGKSNKIKDRVNSYFKKSTEKDFQIIKSACFIEYFLVKNETDAFLLENNLIKKHQPKYNILLKDDKGYPWLCITNERFPRVFISRKKTNKKSFYFGPYVSKRLLQNLYNFIVSFYPIRSCNYNLSADSILKNKYKVCLDYHLKKCNGPCEQLQTEFDYNKNINSIKKLLSGNYLKLIKELEKKLLFFSKQLLFERAEDVKNQIISLKKIKSKSIIVTSKNISVDCFYVLKSSEYIYVNFIRVVEGSVIFLKNSKTKNPGLWSVSFFLESFLSNVFVGFGSLSKEIISNIELPSFHGRKIINPKRGYKKDILNLGYRNLVSFINKKNLNNYNNIVLLKDVLNLKKIPYHIECFDISNLNGNYNIGSCVVFKNGKPSKRDYRFFNINSFVGINDYLAIEEVVFRRYFNNKNLPDLIIIDGGKGQLSSAKKALTSLNLNKLDFISIAKKNEVIYLKNKKEIILKKSSSSLRLIKHIRDEAHRFCLKNHRKKRNKSFINSELNNIPGIGEKSIKKIIIKFKSINKIKSLKKEYLINFLGKKRGTIVFNYFNN